MPGICCVQCRPFPESWTCLCQSLAPSERAEPRRSAAVSVCPACRHSSLCSWLCLQMANAELGLCSMPAPAPGQLFSTQTGKGMCFSVPTAGLLEKILPAPADFITSLPENPKSAGSQRGGEPGRGCRMAVLATGRDTPLGLWLLATAWVTSLSKVNWWHLCDFPLCSVLLPVRSL